MNLDQLGNKLSNNRDNNMNLYGSRSVRNEQPILFGGKVQSAREGQHPSGSPAVQLAKNKEESSSSVNRNVYDVRLPSVNTLN